MRLPTLSLGAVINRAASEPRRYISFIRNGKMVRKSYAECCASARKIAYALPRFARSDRLRIGIHGETSYEWILADIGCLMAGGLSIALYPRAPIARIISVVEDAACDLVLTDDIGTAIALKNHGIEVAILAEESRENLSCIYDLMNEEERQGVDPVMVDDSVPFTVVSTSGTLSAPKLFSVRGEPLLRTIYAFQDLYGLSPDDHLMLCLPLAHLPQRMLLYGSLALSMEISLSSPRRLLTDVAAFKPTVIVAVPKLLNFVAERIRERLQKSMSPLGKVALGLIEKCPLPIFQGIFRPIRTRVFGPRMRCIFVGSAPSSADTMRLLAGLGFPIYEVYGTTELGIIAINSPGKRRWGTVGKPLKWCDLALETETREIRVRTPHPFRHAWFGTASHDRTTAEPDGFERTGDLGAIDTEGYLSVLGRCRDFVALDSGEKIFVSPVERSIETIDGLDACVVCSDGGKRLKAIVFMQDERSADVTDDVVERLKKEITRVNVGLHPWERVYGFSIVSHPPSIESGCLTDTMKVRRLAVIDSFQHLQLHVV